MKKTAVLSILVAVTVLVVGSTSPPSAAAEESPSDRVSIDV